MVSLFKSVRCLECGQRMPADLFLQKCVSCGSAWLDAEYDYQNLPKDWKLQVKERPASLWRYTELLPFPEGFRVISMGEGWTPLIEAEGLQRVTGHEGIWIKDERQTPTGSFKDRQAAMAVSALKAQGVMEVVLASTGNAAAAYAAYCARAGIKLWVFLTSSVPNEKMRELALYGAEVIKITGTYDQAKEVAADFAARRGIRLDGGAKAIPCKESMKTLGFEIAEQLGWQAPDWYIQAVSGGIGPLGVLKGFEELYQAGLTDRVPKLGIVQTEGCAPMVRAWERNLAQAEPVQPDSLITVLATGKPGYAYQILKQATDRYGGAMVAVPDGEAFRAMRRMARLEGFSMEPAASVAFAGLERLLAQGIIKPGERVVVNCSGHTFSAEKHALEDRYAFSLEAEAPNRRPVEGLSTTLEQLDEQVTTVVIIDDNPHDSRLLRRLLQSYKHYRVFESYNAVDGVDLVRQRRPDLVMLDLTMPGMDGFSVLAELKADEATRMIPVVIVSAKSLTQDEWAYLRRYTDSVWQKGNFSARELIDHVVKTLGDNVPPTPSTVAVNAGAERSLVDLGQPGAERPRILVIDDNLWEARLMRRLLEARQRFEVMEAYSGAEALAVMAETAPDLILLDLVLPDIDGVDLLPQLRALDPLHHIPVVVITGKDVDVDLRARLGGEVDSIWSKATMDRNSLLVHVEGILLG